MILEGIKALQGYGYTLLTNKGYDSIGRICLTHSFPNKNGMELDSYIGTNDCSNDEIHKIQYELNNCIYNDYDKLIQLCDSVCMAEGVCLLEVRLIDVVRRYNVYNKQILKKWNEYFEIKKYFDKKCNINIYSLFYEEIIKNSLR